jgi:hypothetical protein
VVHRLRGRTSNRSVDPVKKSRVLKLYREKYGDFGPTLACEYLSKDDELKVGVETMRQWLIEDELSVPRRRARDKSKGSGLFVSRLGCGLVRV